MLGPMGAAGSNCPRFFFSLFPLVFSTSGGVGSDAPGPTRPRFFLVFFHARRIGVSRMSCTSPSIFPLFFFHARRSGVSRRSGIRMGRTRPKSPAFFPLFSTSGGVVSAAGVASAWAAPGPTCPRFFPLFSTSGGVGWRRQLRVEGASQACFFSRVCIISPLEGRRRR